MLQVLGLLVLTAVLFIAFIILLIWGIVKRQWAKFFYGLLVLVSCITTLGYTAYKTLSKIETRKPLMGFTKYFKPRPGNEIYTALFGHPLNCVTVKESRDQVIPKQDDAIRLHFFTCPEEITRILAMHPYLQSIVPSVINGSMLHMDDLIKPQLLGDSVYVFEYRYKPGSSDVQLIYTNKTKTEGYCIDFAD